MILIKEELATVLAALRFYQAAGMGDPFNRSDEIHEIATGGADDLTSLDSDGIDDLCERLNCDDSADDKAAMDAIAEIMSGEEWDAETTDAIAEVVRATGREIKDVDEDEDEEVVEE